MFFSFDKLELGITLQQKYRLAREMLSLFQNNNKPSTPKSAIKLISLKNKKINKFLDIITNLIPIRY